MNYWFFYFLLSKWQANITVSTIKGGLRHLSVIPTMWSLIRSND
jgi:hypothetical protein